MTGWAGCGRLALTLLVLLGVAACSGGGQQASTGAQYGYTPPGPPEDPWGPYINEAAHRFSVPDAWIRAVMHQESGGHEYLNGQPITSDAGAAGLMQIMPATYAELRDQYNLGSDPYNPHDNIIAGAGYIRQMYDRFGAPAFLAAYNAGPQRVEDYMAGRGGLPNETVNYLASVAPRLGNGLPMTGPLVAYADNGGPPLTPDPVPHAYARKPISRCWQDPDAAYDPDAPCRSAPPIHVATSAPPPVQHYAAQANSHCWHDPNAAYDPAAPCRAAPPVAVAEAAPPAQPSFHRANCWHDPNAAYDPEAPCRAAPPVEVAAAPPVQIAQAGHVAAGDTLWSTRLQVHQAPVAAHHNFASYLIPSAAASELPLAHNTGAWGIQVGAFADASQARQMAETARSLAPKELHGAQTKLGPTAPFGGHVLYRARLVGLSAQGASLACNALATLSHACVTVPPGG